MRRVLRGGAWTLALVGLVAGGLLTACAEDGDLVCIDDQKDYPSYDHACKGNRGCKDIYTGDPGCHCDYCADERCVSVTCTDVYPDAGLDASGDMKADAAQPDAAQPDAAQPDAAQPDAAQPDAAQPDASAGDTAVDAPPQDTAMLDAASAAYKDLEWAHSSYQGGFNPHTSTSKLKASALELQTSSLAGGVIKSCKATLTAQQLATLLVAAGKVSWNAVKPNYAGAGCGYPGDGGQLKITLFPPQGASTTVDTKWCVGGGTPLGLPADLVTFLAAMDQLHAAACP